MINIQQCMACSRDISAHDKKPCRSTWLANTTYGFSGEILAHDKRLTCCSICLSYTLVRAHVRCDNAQAWASAYIARACAELIYHIYMHVDHLHRKICHAEYWKFRLLCDKININNVRLQSGSQGSESSRIIWPPHHSGVLL